MFKKLLPIAFVCTIPATAVAGSFENGLYTSNVGYTIMPPKDWTRVDMATVEALRNNLPQNISPEALKRFDVIFYPKAKDFVDTSLNADNARIEANELRLKEEPGTAPEELEPPIVDTSEPAEFVPTISVMTLKHKTTNSAAEYAKVYAQTLQENIPEGASYASDFKVKDSTQTYLVAGDGFVFNVEFRANERSLAVEQAVIFLSDRTFVITCTQDSNEFMRDKNWCKSAYNSLKVK